MSGLRFLHVVDASMPYNGWRQIETNFFQEIPRVLKSFKYSIFLSLLAILMMIILACGSFIPYGWGITSFIAILPLSTICVSHFLLPIVLNSGLMQFTF
ncbi:hypothetical protein LTR62_002275 [Meristemomyces frigidus]|uniref:Uncharacterized protein n=1 Tax=Meristemomyces frigidus TaxID=1508187 RepID=A0AAN7TL07_9PEZI|nr:hypothetical protein LTR62_002275 [Meristemomyces frigidus]